MSILFPAWPLMAAFFLASVVLAVTPGPGVVYVLTRTLAQGRRAGLASALGVACGNLGNAIGASIGLAALFAVSSLAFTIVKYAGAAYLVYLGIKALRERGPADGSVRLDPVPARRLFRDGCLVALLNPKTSIFFAAFLPQFMDPAAPAMLQSVTLGAVFVLVALATDAVYVMAAGMLAPRLTQLRGAGRTGRYLTGGAFIGLGVFTALTGQRSPH